LEQCGCYDIDQIVYVEFVDTTIFYKFNFSFRVEGCHVQITIDVAPGNEFMGLYFMYKPAQNMYQTLGFVKVFFVLHQAVFSELELDVV
jgi:hypothetical protein